MFPAFFCLSTVGNFDVLIKGILIQVSSKEFDLGVYTNLPKPENENLL